MDRKPQLDRTFFFHFNSWVEYKCNRCIDCGGPVDLDPRVIVDYGDDRDNYWHADIPDLDDLHTAVKLFRTKQSEPIKYLLVAFDGYWNTGPPRAAGTLSRAFAAGNPAVHEMLGVVLVDAALGDSVSGCVSYSYAVDGLPVFAKLGQTPNEGHIIQLMTDALGL